MIKFWIFIGLLASILFAEKSSAFSCAPLQYTYYIQCENLSCNSGYFEAEKPTRSCGTRLYVNDAPIWVVKLTEKLISVSNVRHSELRIYRIQFYGSYISRFPINSQEEFLHEVIHNINIQGMNPDAYKWYLNLLFNKDFIVDDELYKKLLNCLESNQYLEFFKTLDSSININQLRRESDKRAFISTIKRLIFSFEMLIVCYVGTLILSVILRKKYRILEKKLQISLILDFLLFLIIMRVLLIFIIGF